MLSKKVLECTTFQMIWKSGVLIITRINHAKAIFTAAEMLTIIIYPNLDQKSIESVSEYSHFPHNHKKFKQHFTPALTDTLGIEINLLDRYKSQC